MSRQPPSTLALTCPTPLKLTLRDRDFCSQFIINCRASNSEYLQIKLIPLFSWLAAPTSCSCWQRQISFTTKSSHFSLLSIAQKVSVILSDVSIQLFRSRLLFSLIFLLFRLVVFLRVLLLPHLPSVAFLQIIF